MTNVRCGFNKWSIGLGDNNDVIIDFNCHPNYGSIHLYDVSVDELENLSKMFASAALAAKTAMIPTWFVIGAKIWFVGLGPETEILSIDINDGSWIGLDYNGQHKYPLNELQQHWKSTKLAT